jgi:para-nitrobenzyl esterase
VAGVVGRRPSEYPKPMREPITTTTSGSVRGFVDEGALAFLGIPYADPPLGKLRFAAPARPTKWAGVRDAIAFGPTAPQSEPGWTIIPEPVEPGDDYLNLNIYTPDTTDSLPVLVWIHGGGFTAGCSRSPWYRGTRFARDGVVLVSIGYRLGIEGFLEIDDAPSNRAILDWIAALGWVQENIASFGGDPSKVTIAGQSAGSAACVYLLTTSRANGLFRGAICQSGVGDAAMTADTARHLGRQLAEQLGVKASRDELARFTPSELMDAHAALGIPQSFDRGAPQFKPFVDGDLVTSAPLAAVRNGAGGDVDVIVGATSEEINGLRFRISAEDVPHRMEEIGLGPEEQRLYMEHVGAKDLHEAAGQAMTDYIFRLPAAKLLDARAIASANTFGYDFRWPSPVNGVGSCHCMEIPFAFDNLDAERVADGLHGPDAPQDLASDMHHSWVQFVTEGDPRWPTYDFERRRVAIFDSPMGLASDLMGVERDLFSRRRETASTQS